MTVSELVDIQRYDDDGYAPVVDYQTWRVAILNFHQELLPDEILAFHCHDETDEVFVLLNGRCLLLVGEPSGPAGARIGSIQAIELSAGAIHNVRRGVWHSHTLDRNAKVLIVENQDTDTTNSRETALSAAQRAHVISLCDVAGFRSSPL